MAIPNRDAFEPEDPRRKQGLGDELGGLDLTDEGSLLSQDLALQGMMPGDAPYNFTQYELNQPRYGLSGRFSRTGSGRTPFEQMMARKEGQTVVQEPPTQYKTYRTSGQLRVDDAGADAFGFGTGATGVTGADQGFGLGSGFGEAIDQYGGFDLGFAGKYGTGVGLGTAGTAGMALNLGASPGAALGFGLKGLGMAATNPLAMAGLFAAGLDQSIDRADFASEVMGFGSGLGLSDTELTGALTGQSLPTRETAAVQQGVSDLGDLRSRRGILGRAMEFGSDILGLGGTSHVSNIDLAEALASDAEMGLYGDFEAGDIPGFGAPSVTSGSAATARATSPTASFGESLTGMALSDAATASEAKQTAIMQAALAGDRSGFGSRGMGIHGGVSDTEAAMAGQAAAADMGGGDGGGGGK